LTASLVDGVLDGDRRAVARVISMIEDGDRRTRDVMDALHPHAGRAYSVGITGAPGAGKSSLTDRLVTRARREGESIAVLAIDPSSPFSGGALLGDRVRMQSHATDAGVFIRSMATRGHLGGLALATPEAMRALDAAGNDHIVVETVGVGQAEVEVADLCDATVVVVTPGWGDAVQAAKAGLMEIADVFVVNKADRDGVRDTVRQLRQMLEQSTGAWRPPIVPTVATRDEGIDELWDVLAKHRRFQHDSGELEVRRRARIRREIRAIVVQTHVRAFDERAAAAVDELTGAVLAGKLDPYAAAEQLLAGSPSV
jgi:LAO/AO transport system kinase